MSTLSMLFKYMEIKKTKNTYYTHTHTHTHTHKQTNIYIRIHK